MQRLVLVVPQRPQVVQERRDEREEDRDALEQQRQFVAQFSSAAADLQARQSLVRILLNHNDFVTIR